jgi:hypothetical protein
MCVTLGQTLAQNPSQPLDLPCPSRTFVAFSKIHLNNSISPNVKVVQFVKAHNFHVARHFKLEVQIGEKLKSTPAVTIPQSRENPQVPLQFMPNRLIKTPINLYSCRGVLDLQV